MFRKVNDENGMGGGGQEWLTDFKRFGVVGLRDENLSLRFSLLEAFKTLRVFYQF